MLYERLRLYREGLGITKREMSKRIGISETYYNMVENGTRQPSKNFIDLLVIASHKPEEYWLYGINDSEYVNSREELKSVRKAIEQILELGLVKDINTLFQGTYKEGTIEELLIAALKADIEYLIMKRNDKK